MNDEYERRQKSLKILKKTTQYLLETAVLYVSNAKFVFVLLCLKKYQKQQSKPKTTLNVNMITNEINCKSPRQIFQNKKVHTKVNGGEA